MTSFIESTPRLKRRHAAENRFRWAGRIAILISLGFLAVMTISIGWTAVGALSQTHIALDVDLGPEAVDLAKVETMRFGKIVKNTIAAFAPISSKQSRVAALARPQNARVEGRGDLDWSGIGPC